MSPCDELTHVAYFAEKHAIGDALYRIDRPPEFGPASRIHVKDPLPRRLKLRLKGSRERRPELVEPFGLAIPFPSLYFQIT